VRWFHSGGLFAALSETTAELILEAMQEARRRGIIVSFDLNYRAKLWNASGGRDRARSVFRRIAPLVDVLVGNEEDVQQGLGIQGPQLGSGTASALDSAAFFAMIERVIETYPQIKVVATTLRDVRSTNRHTWSAVAWIDGEQIEAPVCELDIYDRVGGGDAFASGLFYGLLTREAPADAVRLGWAHGALVTTFPGDTSMATLEDVRAFASGGSARIQR
jgi:2-dehydro-3-deoxygluconokinase